MDNKYSNTTNVSIVFFNETICLSAMLDLDLDLYLDLEKEIKIEKSKMNKTPNHNYCIEIKMPITENIIANLKVYSAKIIISGIKPTDNIIQLLNSYLDNLKIKYNITIGKNIDITLLSLGTAENVQQIDTELQIKLDNISIKRKMIVKGASMHITGVNSPKYFDIVINKFIKLFSTDNIAPRLTLNKKCNIMSNSNFSLEYKLNIWKIASLIKTAPGFDNGKSFCIYNNIKSAHQVVIVLKIDIPLEEKCNYCRTNLESTFTVKNTGAVMLSSPSLEIGLQSFKLFLNAINYLGDVIKR